MDQDTSASVDGKQKKAGFSGIAEERSLPIQPGKMCRRANSITLSFSDLADPGGDAADPLPWPQDVLELLERPKEAKVARRVPTPDLIDFPPAASSRKLSFSSGSFSIPHPEKASSTGADSFFCSHNGCALGVADGVGEWEWRFGINARAFADELMSGCEDLLNMSDPISQDAAPGKLALHALEQGFQNTKSFGSSTALVAVMNRSGQLGVANIGDSALLILRRKEVDAGVGLRCVGRSHEQQHAFNCPYQLSLLPTDKDFPALVEQGKDKLVRALQRRPTAKMDLPQDADLYSFSLQEGDLLVLGTDGVFDNLYVHEVCQLAGRAQGPCEASEEWPLTEPAIVAKAIVKAAFHRSKDRGTRSPFSDHAKQAGLYHTGGKMDDITCVCAWVVAE